MKFVALTRRKDIVIGLGILLVAAILAQKVVYSPKAKKIERLRSQIREEEEKNRLLGEIDQIDQTLHSYQKKTPSGREVSWVLDKVTKIAKDMELSIISLEPQPPDDRGAYVRLPLKLEVECGYHELGRFLSQIESSEEFLRIESLQVKTGEQREKERSSILKKPRATLVISSIYVKEH